MYKLPGNELISRKLFYELGRWLYFIDLGGAPGEQEKEKAHFSAAF